MSLLARYEAYNKSAEAVPLEDYPMGGIKVLPQNKWVEVERHEIADKIAGRLWDIYDLTYGKIGKHIPNAEAFTKKYKMFYLADVDEDIHVDAFIAYKRTRFGKKITLAGTDGSRLAKKAMILQLKALVKKSGVYTEASHKIAQIIESTGAKPIDDEQLVRALLKGKDITWLGDGKYSRDLGALGNTVKSMYGKPRV